MKPRLYLETIIPSYLVARRSRDLRLAADQETTQEWWEERRQNYELFISEFVREEVQRGDAQASGSVSGISGWNSDSARTSNRDRACRTHPCHPVDSASSRVGCRCILRWPPFTGWIIC